MKKVIVKKNRYVDSVSLMGVSERVTALQGIANAEAQMATCANRDVLKLLGYELPATGGPGIYPLMLASVLLILTPLVYSLVSRRKRGRRSTG